MITGWTMYLITRLDSLAFATGWVLGLSALFVAAVFVFSTAERHAGYTSKPEKERILAYRNKWVRIPATAAACAMAVLVLTPTTKEMAAILVIPAIANSDTLLELGDDALVLTREWLKELRPATTKGGELDG